MNNSAGLTAIPKRVLRVVGFVMLAGLLFAGLTLYHHPRKAAQAADHRDSPTADANPEGDITDFFAFVDPNDNSQLVLIVNVNPFSVPAENPSYSFSNEFLYQFKFANDNDADEDLVIQAVFKSVPTTTCPSGQIVKIFGPSHPERKGAKNVRLHGRPAAQGCTGSVFNQGEMKVFTGQRDDPFVTDVGQLFRIRGGLQDVYRNFTSPVLGMLRGRAVVHPDGSTGIDGFGGFNVSSLAIEIPKNWVRGAGFLGDEHLLGLWATVSRPERKDHDDRDGGDNRDADEDRDEGRVFMQFQRMGQQLFKTIFVPSDLREAFNAEIPAHDTVKFSFLVPDALTTSDNDGTGNTLSGRRAVLTAVGVVGAPNGAPLLLPANFGNTNKNLLRIALLPDVLRLDLDAQSDDLEIGQFGLQNGRRPADNVTEILMRLARELADIKFPDSSGVPGSGPLGIRKPLDCTGLPSCPDRRVLVVLQGTQFIKPDSQLGDLTTSGNDRAFLTVFPFLATPHPLPGEAGTVGFPPQQ